MLNNPFNIQVRKYFVVNIFFFIAIALSLQGGLGTGRVLLQQAFSKESVLNVKALTSGMYVLTLKTEIERVVVKFVKE